MLVGAPFVNVIISVFDEISKRKEQVPFELKCVWILSVHRSSEFGVGAGEMGKPTKQLKQMEALFVPNRRGSLEFAGVVEATPDQNCDIHGRRGSAGSVKRDSISSTATGHSKRDSVSSAIGNSSKRDSVDGLFGNSYLSNYTVLKRGESVDRDHVANGDGHPVVTRRRSSGQKAADTRYEQIQ